MKHLTAYAASVAEFATAMMFNVYADDDPDLRVNRIRDIIDSPRWPIYLVAARVFIRS